MAQHNELGKKGEEIALQHLRKKGYEILNTNWRFGKEEVDIIAKNSEYIVFVEVKSRQSNYFGEPEFFVTDKKQRHIINAADHYIVSKDIELEGRFDIISIIIKGKEHRLHHIEDAFYPTL